MQHRAILFDKDGTLFEFDQPWKEYCHLMLDVLCGANQARREKFARACGFDLQADCFTPGSVIVGGSVDQLCHIWADLSDTHSASSIHDLSEKIAASIYHRPVCDLEKLCKRLHALGYHLGVVTNDLEQSAIAQLKKEGVYEYFDGVYGSDSGFNAKPNPGMIQAFSRKHNIPPKQLVMVGDSEQDFISADRAGVGLRIGVLSGPASMEKLGSMSDVVLASIEDIPAYLEANYNKVLIESTG